ncbi:MAG: hypothetical protein IK044_08820 [Methanobrevibacter sp.]|nr:hypothetical protein [Methanobrevibacter sp.]
MVDLEFSSNSIIHNNYVNNSIEVHFNKKQIFIKSGIIYTLKDDFKFDFIEDIIKDSPNSSQLDNNYNESSFFNFYSSSIFSSKHHHIASYN